MNPVLEHLCAHRSERDFSDRPVGDDTLAAVFEATRRAPTWNNAQNVSWVAVRDPRTKAALARCSGNQAWIARAPVFVVLLMDFYKTELAAGRHGRRQAVLDNVNSVLIGALDTGILMGTMMAAARAAGLGVCPIGGVRRGMLEVIELLRLPRLVAPLAGVCLGYLNTASEVRKPRMALEASWHAEAYDRDRVAGAIDALDADMDAYSRGLGREGAQSWSDAVSSRYAADAYGGVGPALRRQGFCFEWEEGV
ncbi:nitroreductase family protein [Pigmentiphaga sp. GD03639]|uniref:NADPH-dependent oxidoreductase n=1 Tax=Pigmentiphaga daeguensis TaxID=414049 RepID=A0ABP3MNG7_9BURK|nr:MULTISPECIES: nitroreductase family protein [unclassified Pigmentiphaga]MDH2235897.1 nitroreductase family protein [Pigmentiphaga sp. GD03639]